MDSYQIINFLYLIIPVYIGFYTGLHMQCLKILPAVDSNGLLILYHALSRSLGKLLKNYLGVWNAVSVHLFTVYALETAHFVMQNWPKVSREQLDL
jgi:formate-dependent nitrite reductase membrane component NrfD